VALECMPKISLLVVPMPIRWVKLKSKLGANFKLIVLLVPLCLPNDLPSLVSKYICTVLLLNDPKDGS
jgi:hypothetical protein